MVITGAMGRHLRSYPHARFPDHEDLLRHPLLDDHLSRARQQLRVGPWTKAYGTPLIYALDLISRTRGWLIFEDVWRQMDCATLGEFCDLAWQFLEEYGRANFGKFVSGETRSSDSAEKAITLRGSDIIDSKTGFRCANVKVSTWLFPVLIRTSAILLLLHKTGNIFGTDPANTKMFQRSEPPRSQASPILAQNVLSVMRVRRCLLDCWKSWWVEVSFWLCGEDSLFIGKVLVDALNIKAPTEFEFVL
ncbi:unnamed protein product [Vicia faba]|uniref:Fungal-type protein kinase domain-containing protein n=1 Tax=Vicia faba TaxID=3906 RepID=A0AAV1B220_VICFA|nr:unnamed protein product [Vicia faba]